MIKKELKLDFHLCFEQSFPQKNQNNGQNDASDEVNSISKVTDFLNILVQARDSDGNGLTFREIRNEVDTFLFEGI